jgi:hypothetical protein
MRHRCTPPPNSPFERRANDGWVAVKTQESQPACHRRTAPRSRRPAWRERPAIRIPHNDQEQRPQKRGGTFYVPLRVAWSNGPKMAPPNADISTARSARDFAWSYLDSSLAKGYPSFCQSANSITTAVTLVKPISLSCLAASVARPPLAHCTYILRFMSTLFG